MRVVHLSAYDLLGGAAKAAFRLHGTLADLGVESTLLVRRRDSTRDDVLQPQGAFMKLWSRVQRRCDRLPLMMAGAAAREYSPGWVPDGLAGQLQALQPDIVHLHWVAHGFVRPDLLPRIGVPVVWTMHDMWPFTGGCHYAGACRNFTQACGRCPLLGGQREADLSRAGWQRRRQAFARKRVTFVSPSRWLAAQARTSALLNAADIRVIPNGIDEACFVPHLPSTERRRWGLPPDKIVLLAGSAQLNDNPRKGFGDLLQALEILRGAVAPGSVELALFGGARGPVTELAGFPAHNLGVLTDDQAMASVYAAADVFVAPSLEDNLPNTIIEAMAVGTPVVAYAAGGIPEIVDHEVNGLVVPVGQVAGLAAGMLRMCTDGAWRRGCGQRAREKVEQVFGRIGSAGAYRDLYEELSGRT